jgi:phosphomannomutase
MNRKFLFDVDGTLTPSRQKIDSKFADFFLDFCNSNKVYLVTGSDRKKTEEQLNISILNSAQMVFNCAGNEVWSKNEIIHRNFWKPSETLILCLEEELESSQFPHKTGIHIEQRTGMVNFSIVGRKCDLLERREYILWDRQTNERELIAAKIQRLFPNLDVYIGGETGIDIFEKGYGKSQCVSFIKTSSEDYLYYFGDQIFPGGNDFDIATMCNSYRNVQSWKSTYESLQFLMEVL